MNLTSTAIKRLALSLLLFFVIGVSTLMSQTYYDRITNVQTPNVANLGVYGEIPITPFTGTPNISIPLYELNLEGLKFPITLSYHSGSVKPDQHPSWVGLGWTLNAGGVIYRTINEGPDEYSAPGIFFDYTHRGYYFQHSILDNDSWNNADYLKERARTTYTTYWDRAPDEFSFQFLEYSGKFWLSEKGEWKVQCSKPIKVEFNGNFVDIPKDLHWPPNEMRRNQTPTFAGFTLIDEKGNRFEFGYTSSAIEYSKKFFKQGLDIWFANAWHLTGIVLANGQNVRLNYERGAYIDQLYSSYMRVLDQEGKNPKWSSCNSSFASSQDMTINGELLSPVYLESINGENEDLEFNRTLSNDLRVQSSKYHDYFTSMKLWPAFNLLMYDLNPEQKEDLDGCLSKLKWYKLSDITVERKNGYPNMHLVLDYDENPNQRLILKSIREEDMQHARTAKKYSFEYNRPDMLPPYLSNETDHWGYYNAREASIMDLDGYYAKKEANPNCASLGLLTKITYPTGGYTRLVFEPHQYSKNLKLNRWEGCFTENVDKYAGGVRIKEIYSSPTDRAEDETLVHRYYFSKSKDGRSSGVCGGQFKYFYRNNTIKPFGNKSSKRVSIFTSSSVLPACANSQGTSVGYTDVIETNADGSYQKYHYTNFDNGHLDERFECNMQQGMENNEQYANKGQERGLLLRKQSFDNTGKLRQDEDISYVKNKIIENYVRAMNANCYNICGGEAGSYGEGVCYKIYTYSMLPATRREVFFENGDSLVKQFRYNYNARGILQETITTLPTNDKLRHFITYAEDMKATPTYDAMVNRHMVGVPIEQFTFRNSSLVDATLNTFKLNIKNSWPVLDKVYHGMFKLPYSKTEPVRFDGETVPQRYGEAEIQFNNYDASNNYREAIGKGGRRVVFFWQKGFKQPVAIFKNAQNNRDTIYEKRVNRVCKGLAVECKPYAKKEITFTTEQETEVEVEMFFPESDKKDFFMYVGVDQHTVNLLIDFRRDPQNRDRYYAKLGRISAGKHTLHVVVEYVGKEGKADESGYSVYAKVNCYYTVITSLPPRIVGYNNVFYEGFEHGRGKNTFPGGFHSNWGYRGLYRARLDIDPKKRYFIDYQVYHNGSWQYKCAPFTGGEYIINENNEPIDDIRIYPEDAEVMSFNYDGTGQITSRTDQRGYTYSYGYDAFGRLVSEHDTDWNTLRSYEYHYKNQEAK